MKTIEVKTERLIPAPVAEVFDAWLDPRVPGTPWQMHDKLIFDPRLDALWYWLIGGTAHYGRFTALERPRRVEQTWVSPYTLGHESILTVTFEKQGEGTLMKLTHSNLPDDEGGRGHEEGWKSFLDEFPKAFSRYLR